MNISPQQQRKLFEQHLHLQQKHRQSKLQLKKLQAIQKKNPEQHMLYIQKQFKNKIQCVNNAIKKYKDKSILFDSLMAEYLLVKDYFVNVNYALKSYDRQSYKQTLDKLYNTIIELKKKYEPRKKFKFSRRQQDFGVKQNPVIQQFIINQNSQSNIPGISDINNQTLKVNEGGQTIGSYRIVNCTDSQIQLLDKTQILFIKNLANCKISTALTKSTVFVQNCHDCTIEINCHQLRIHNTFNTTFKIFVTSRAIIQNCNKIIFSPYKFLYPNRQQDQILFQRNNKQNLWKQVQDFNWLKQNIKSPHFDLIQ